MITTFDKIFKENHLFHGMSTREINETMDWIKEVFQTFLRLLSLYFEKSKNFLSLCNMGVFFSTS